VKASVLPCEYDVQDIAWCKTLFGSSGPPQWSEHRFVQYSLKEIADGVSNEICEGS